MEFEIMYPEIGEKFITKFAANYKPCIRKYIEFVKPKSMEKYNFEDSKYNLMTNILRFIYHHFK